MAHVDLQYFVFNFEYHVVCKVPHVLRFSANTCSSLKRIWEMERLTIATACSLSIFLPSAPSWAYQEYCTLISFFSVCCGTFPVFCVSCCHRDKRCSKALGRRIEAGLWGNSPCWLEKPKAGIYSSKWKEGIVWSDLTVCP